MAAPNPSRSVNRAAIVLAFLIAAMQSYGVARGVAAAHGFVSEPDLGFFTETLVCALGSTALLLAAATAVSRAGGGDALLVLFAASAIARATGIVFPLMVAPGLGSAAAIRALAFAALLAALLVAAALASPRQPAGALGFGGGRLDPFPPLIASAVAPLVRVLVARLLWPELAEDPLAAALVAAIVAAAFIALIAAMRAGLPGAPAPRPYPWPATLATAAVVAVMPVAGALWPDTVILRGSDLVIVVAAALSVLSALGLLPRRSATRANDAG